MESGESSSVHVPAELEVTHTPGELLGLLRRLVDVLDEMIHVQKLPEFHTIIRQLCEKDLEAAQALATTIQETNNSVRNSLQQEQDVVGKRTSRAKGKLVSGKDLSYRPPNSAKVKAAGTISLGDSRLPTNEREIHIDCLNENTAAHGIPCSVPDIDDIISPDETAVVNPEAWNESIDASQVEPSSEPDQRQYITEDEQVPKGEGTADDRASNETAKGQDVEGSLEATGVALASNIAENKQSTVLPQSMPHSSPTPLAQADTAPATPTKPMEGQPASPQTEEIHREKIPMSLQSIASSPRSITASSSADIESLSDMILEAVRVIHQLSKYQHAASLEVHKRILTTLRAYHQEALTPSSLTQWSDGSRWMEVLEMGSSENQKVTILNMLEYMGAWEWYNTQIEQSQAIVRTKKNKPVGRRGAAIVVLNKMQGMDSAPRGKWISGVGRVAFGGEGNEPDLLPENRNVDITERARLLQRKRISMQLSRGQRLSTLLVKKLGLGILFSSKIWEYTKKSVEQLDILIRNVQADAEKMKLLQILSQQLEQLVHEGRPDLHAFCNALKEERLLSGEEFRQLGTTFVLDGDALPKGTLDAAVDRLVQDVSTRVLGKRTLEDSDSVAVNDGPELSCDIFDKLRKRQWFNAWTIMAAMQISDKPSFVRYGYSVPLDEIGKKRKMKAVQTPLAGWSRKLDEFRREAGNKSEDAAGLVYFCPLNHRNKHFSLLEINERKKTIRHYDSMADQGTINHNSKPTRVDRLVQSAFGHLQYAYSEATTPQQSDSWSCGMRVAWNYSRLANNLPIGGWHDVLDPERMKLELVEGLLACVESNAMTRGKRRKS